MLNIAIKNHFLQQANACRAMGSALTGKICEQLTTVLDNSTKVGQRIETWPGDPAADALSLRLCGALHSLVIENHSDPLAPSYRETPQDNFGEILADAIQRHDEVLNSWLDLPPQTNEIGRAAALLPGFLTIVNDCSKPLQICEIGSSAGLNLQLDKFHYDFGTSTWGDTNSPVQLKPELTEKIPDLSGEMAIFSRIGCDIAPLDITNRQDSLRLRSYIWPDQAHRIERLDGAIKLALAHPPNLIKQDAAQFVEEQLASRHRDKAFVLMHSVVWQYLPQPTQTRIQSALVEHGIEATRDNPIYWLRLEGLGGKEPAAGLLLDQWPKNNSIKLANSCFHGNWIEFL